MLIVIRKYLLLILCFASLSFVQAQSSPSTSTSVVDLLERLSQTTSYTINYDPDLLQDYKCVEPISNKDINSDLTLLLSNTPFEFQINEDIIIILLSTRKKYEICGIILDSLNIPLVGANIYHPNSNHGTVTGPEGQFTISLDAVKNEPINISYVGFQPKVMNVSDLSRNEECDTKIILKAGRYLTEGLEIRAHHLLPGVYEGDDNSININYEQLSQVAANEEYDVLNTVQLLPGINSTDESASNLHIRGATPDQNVVLWEGVTIYDPGHMFGMISSINPFVVDRVEVHRGIFHPKYTNRIGGVLDVSLADEISTRIIGGVGTTMTEAHAFVETPILQNQLGITVAGRHTINGIINSPTLVSYSNKIFQNNSIEFPPEESISDDDETENSFYFYDYNAKVIYQPNDKLTLKASIFQSLNDFTASSSLFDGELEFAEIVLADNQAFSGDLEYRWNDKLSSNLFIKSSFFDNTYIYTQSDEDEDELDYESAASNAISDFQIGLNNSLHLDFYNSLEFGYSLESKEVAYKIEEYTSDGFDFESEETVEGIFHNFYGSYQHLNELLALNMGVRAVYHEERSTLHFAPRLNARYEVGDHFFLKAGLGKFYQYISQIQDFGVIPLLSSNGLWRLYDENDQNVLESSKFTTGFVYNGSGWLVDVEGYFGTSSGLSAADMVTDTDIFFETDLNSEIKGVDLLIKKKWKNYQVWLNYSLSQNDYFEEEFSDFIFSANNDRPHNLSIVNNWMNGPLSLSLTFHYRSGLPYSAPTGIEQFIDATGNISNALVYDDLNSFRLKDYLRWDINASYRLTFADKWKGEISLSLLNLFDRQNVFSRSYQIGNIGESNELEAFSVDKNLLGFTPKLLVRFHF